MRATLEAEVADFLREHGPSTASQIAAGVRSRRTDITTVLAAGPFSRAAAPLGATPSARHFDLSQPVPQRLGRPSRAKAMLAVLSDGRWHSRDEIFRLSGQFFLTNNAAAELRSQGHNIVAGQEGHVFMYQLAPSAAA